MDPNPTTNKKRTLLIVDVDETLVHTTEEPLPNRGSDFMVGSLHVHIRPHAIEFLTDMAEEFDIAFWSAGGHDYVHAVLERIVPSHIKPVFIWTAERCTSATHCCTGLKYVIKDLAKVKRKGFDLNRVLIVDDTRNTASRNYGNVVYVQPFAGQLDDDELRFLSQYLLTLASVENVRAVEKRGWRQRLHS